MAIADTTPRILILGDVAAAEMRPVVRDVISVFAGSEIRVSPFDISVSGAEDPSGWSPDLVVVCQCEPDEFSRDDVLALITRCPLSRLVCCFGQWCEADGRTRDLWPLAVRIPARMAAMRLRRERDVLCGTKPVLPLTGGREEAYEFGTARIPAVNTIDGLQAKVLSPDRELRVSFEERLRSLGYRIDRDQTDSDPDVILFDADPWNDRISAALRQTRDAKPQAAIIALMNFARPEDVHAVTRCGADDVLAKLVNQEQLAAVLCRQSASFPSALSRNA